MSAVGWVGCALLAAQRTGDPSHFVGPRRGRLGGRLLRLASPRLQVALLGDASDEEPELA